MLRRIFVCLLIIALYLTLTVFPAASAFSGDGYEKRDLLSSGYNYRSLFYGVDDSKLKKDALNSIADCIEARLKDLKSE